MGRCSHQEGRLADTSSLFLSWPRVMLYMVVRWPLRKKVLWKRQLRFMQVVS